MTRSGESRSYGGGLFLETGMSRRFFVYMGETPKGVEMTDETKAIDENSTDESAAQESETEATAAELRAQVEKQKNHIAALNKESADRRKKLEAFEKADTDRKTAELSEIEKIEAKVKAIEVEKNKLEAENKTLKLQGAFNAKVTALKLEFINEYAAEDAYKSLAVEDVDGMEDAIKKLLKDRPYLFTAAEQSQQLNDGARKTKGVSQEQVNADVLALKRRNYQPI